MEPSTYPVTFSVEYPERQLNRLTTFFRIVTVIPIAIVAQLLQDSGFATGNYAYVYATAFAGGGLIVMPIVLMLLFRKKYPRWWFDWNLELTRFLSRIGIYLALMDDRYPSTDEQQSVHLHYPDPTTQELERGMPLVKWLLAIPHYIVLFVLFIGVFFAVIGAWFAILVTGRYPRAIFGFVEGVSRWSHRVSGYAYTLVTDEYPPFRLKP
ncbi:MAG: DUF4389 domain-containing protein [Solirubrobacterales bacterium]